MSIKLKKINFFFVFILFSLIHIEFANSNQELFQKQPTNLDNYKNYISEVGIENDDNFIWQKIFFDKSYDDTLGIKKLSIS